MNGRPLVIVGGSYAGLQVAASVREFGFAEPIYLLSEEAHAPYQRPPLSKGLLTGKTAEDQLALRAPAFFVDQRIELLTGIHVDSVHPGARRVLLTGGKTLDYAWLALTTGASCRPLALPGADLAGIFNLRTLDDARAVAVAAEAAERICVIGGGYIGLEVAAALRTRGKSVTVLENAPRVLGRSMHEVMSAYVQRAHLQRGVDLRTAQVIRALQGAQGRVAAVEFTDGTRLSCDMVVLGIGVLPNAGLAAGAGIAISNGIDVDAYGRTSAAGVVAAGDVACMQLPFLLGGPARMRLESIQAANDGAKAAAATIVGRLTPCTAVPWFWSDQFELKFQMAGLAQPGDEVVVRGDMEADRFSVGYLRSGTLAAMHSVNRPAEHMLARKLIASRARLSLAQLRDASFDLKQALEPAASGAAA